MCQVRLISVYDDDDDDDNDDDDDDDDDYDSYKQLNFINISFPSSNQAKPSLPILIYVIDCQVPTSAYRTPANYQPFTCYFFTISS